MSSQHERSTEQPKLRMLAGYWLPVLAWMSVILWFSSQSNLPHAQDPLLEIIVKKSAHAGEYAILGLLLVRAFAQGAIATPRRAVAFAWIVALLYAASDEFHQSFTPGRTPSPVDVLIDTSGVTIALFLARRYDRVLRKRGATKQGWTG